MRGGTATTNSAIGRAPSGRNRDRPIGKILDECVRIEPQVVVDRGQHVVEMNAARRGVSADFVGRADHLCGAHAAAK